MKAIEMETFIHEDGKLPADFREAFGHKARVIILLKDDTGQEEQIRQDSTLFEHSVYHENDDPAIALISGPDDYSVRAEEILSGGLREHSGWTVKEPKNDHDS